MVEGVHIGFLILLPVVAFLYSSVGHGGASGYLALMALFTLETAFMKQTALTLNLFVAGTAFFHYFKAGYFNWRIFLWFALGSIPAAYFGGTIELDPVLYKRILGLLLLVSMIRMLMNLKEVETSPAPVRIVPAIGLGVTIGLFSGLIGIGGGIILTPVLILLHWARMKEAAAVSALFIWVNSAAGLTGQWYAGAQFDPNTWLFVALATIGGFAGGYFGSSRWSNRLLTYFLVGVLGIAAVKLFLI